MRTRLHRDTAEAQHDALQRRQSFQPKHYKVVRVAVKRRATAAGTAGGASPNAMLTTEELAQLLRVDPSTVRRWRTVEPRQGPPFIKMSERMTLYLWEDVQEWLRSKRTMPERSR